MTATALSMTWQDLMERFPSKPISTDAGTITCRQAGTGPDVVLLHGIGSASGSWIFQLHALSERCRLTAWDAPGYGGSDDPASSEPETYCDALAALLDARNIRQCVLVGHSLGALMAGYFAAANPALVRGLVLANPAAGHRRIAEDEAHRKMQVRLDRFDELGAEDHARARAPALLSAEATTEQLALVEANMAQLRGSGYHAAARLLKNGDLVAQLPGISCPALVMCGSADTITPPAGARQLAGAFKRPAPYVEIADAGHASPIEAPGVFNEHLDDFLEGLP